jgi:chemotaxis protein MotB
MAKKKREAEEVKGDWIVTYSDMVTLLLCFFVALFDASDASATQVAQMMASINALGMGSQAGGNTMSLGQLADLGNTVMSLPSTERGSSLGTALKKAVSLFNPETRSSKVKITHDERGLVISLAADAFFAPASADINIEESREVLLRVGAFLASEDVAGRQFRIEGHTDSVGIDPDGPWKSNWELSTARSLAVLHYLTDIGVAETRFQVAGFADTKPVASNDTAEGRAHNRRVDIIILDEGHL